MQILFISYNFPPEVNALARRTFEHCREWVRWGAEVEVITDVPHFPEGRVYPGYRNRFTRQSTEGIHVLRVPQFIHGNRGVLLRSLSFLTFMISAVWHSRHARPRPDIVIGSSPQFLAALAAYVVSRTKGAPFVLEIRDIWPESAVATGIVHRSLLVRFLERVEVFLYRRAEHIVVVTDSFVDYLCRKGVPREKITVIKNGVDLAKLAALSEARMAEDVRREHGLEGRFVVSYIGTLGSAHKADVLLEAARQSQDPDVVFLLVGTGSEHENLRRLRSALDLGNVRIIDKQPHERIFAHYAASDLGVVHLRDAPLFRTVIPSKIFEWMAVGRPILLGVRGEAERLVVEAGAGESFPPENPGALLDAIGRLKADPAARRAMADSGRAWVSRHHDRRRLALLWLDLLREIARRQTASTAARP